MKFRKSASKNRYNLCRKMAQDIVKAAEMMQVEADYFTEGNSHFAHCAAATDDGDPFIVQCADGDYSDVNFAASPDMCPSEPIKAIAEHYGKEMPKPYTHEAYQERSLSAQKSAVTRLIKAYKEEAEIVVALRKNFDLDKFYTLTAIYREIDQHYPNIAGAKRRRIAHEIRRIIEAYRKKNSDTEA